MTKRTAIDGGSFNPAGVHHREIAQAVMSPRNPVQMDEEVVVPCGPRPDKQTTNDIEPVHRATICDLTFSGIRGLRLDLFDLEASTFSRQHELIDRYKAGGNEVWNVVGADLIKGGAKGQSPIQKMWSHGKELWRHGNFLVIRRDGYELTDADLPPNCSVVDVGGHEGLAGASSDLRRLIFDRQPYEGLVVPAAHEYIERYNLYRGPSPTKTTVLRIPNPKPLFAPDTRNPKAVAIAAKYAKMAEFDGKPNCIVSIGGDGHMLRTVRKHWRLRLPFVGINAGHVGYLLNDRKLFTSLRKLLADLRVHLLTQLSVEVEDLKGNITHHYAFNDAWVRDTGQAAWLDVTIDGRASRMIGDGALVSTPAGSTGYAWSMGATPILADADEILLVGNNLQVPRRWRSIRLPKDTVVELVADGGKKRRVRGFVDGKPLGYVHRMRCTSSKIASVELAFSPKRDLAVKLRDQMFPE